MPFNRKKSTRYNQVLVVTELFVNRTQSIFIQFIKICNILKRLFCSALVLLAHGFLLWDFFVYFINCYCKHFETTNELKQAKTKYKDGNDFIYYGSQNKTIGSSLLEIPLHYGRDKWIRFHNSEQKRWSKRVWYILGTLFGTLSPHIPAFFSCSKRGLRCNLNRHKQDSV